MDKTLKEKAKYIADKLHTYDKTPAWNNAYQGALEALGYNVEYEPEDFVQVLGFCKSGDELIGVWRNALYVRSVSGNHSVIYSDGQIQICHQGVEIRRPPQLLNV